MFFVCLTYKLIYELFVSRALYFIDSRHAGFFFQIFTSPTLRYILQLIASSVYNWQHLFFLFGTGNNRAFKNPWHLMTMKYGINSLSAIFISKSFHSYCLTFIFVLLCPLFCIFKSMSVSHFQLSSGQNLFITTVSFCPEIITKPTFFGSTWPLTPQYFKSFHKVSSYLKCLVT